MNRREQVLTFVRPAGRRGLEIGPLTRPIVRRSDGDILYADHCSTEDLRRKYAGQAIPGGDGSIVAVDVPLDGRTLAQALGGRGPLDYIVASHVMEHVADPIGWLLEAAEVLKEEGLLCLVVPDKRFTFDHFRNASSTGDLIGAHLAGLIRPSPSQVYDHIAHATRIDPFAVWRGESVRFEPVHGGGLAEALRLAREVSETGFPVDAHCSVFTPYSFARVFRELVATGLIPFAFAAFEPTPRSHADFLVLLRKDAGRTVAERARTVPDPDPRRHHALPGRGATDRLLAAAHFWKRA